MNWLRHLRQRDLLQNLKWWKYVVWSELYKLGDHTHFCSTGRQFAFRRSGENVSNWGSYIIRVQDTRSQIITGLFYPIHIAPKTNKIISKLMVKNLLKILTSNNK